MWVAKARMAEPVNVVCLKWGTLYDARYVNILRHMVARNLKRPFRFICFTEDAAGLEEGIEVFPLPEFPEPDWEYARFCSAWRKLALFRAGLADMQGKVLFLDLDVVITGELDVFFDYSPHLAMIENWYQPGRQVGQASVMCFEAGEPQALLDRYLDNPTSVLERYRTEQAYISGELGASGCVFFPEHWCVSFKKHCMPGGLARWRYTDNAPPESARIVVFHGRPNPPDALVGSWGKPMPRLKRWYKALQPSPWIGDFWR